MNPLKMLEIPITLTIARMNGGFVKMNEKLMVLKKALKIISMMNLKNLFLILYTKVQWILKMLAPTIHGSCHLVLIL